MRKYKTYPQIIFLFILASFLVNCGSPPRVQEINHSLLLSEALASNQIKQAKQQSALVNKSKNSEHIIKLYMILQEQGELALYKEISYFQQFYPQMISIHQSMVNEMKQWLYLKQIYRQEIAPPVRILQRDSLFLAPSNISFSKCNTIPRTYCANDARKELLKINSTEQIATKLKSMAEKDPCANLSPTLKGEFEANKCLRSSKGNLQVELIIKPQFTVEQWLHAISL